MKNLRFAYPEKTDRELTKISKRFYRFLCDLFFETAKLNFWSEKKIMRHMTFVNFEEINDLIRSKRSVSLFLGHYGNWEWISSMSLWLDKNIAGGQIYKKLTSNIADRLMIDNRSKFGVECIEMSHTLRHIHQHKTAGDVSVTGYLYDQSPMKEESKYFIDFMHKKTPVLTGTERITKRYGFEAYYVDVRRIKRGRWQAEFVRLHPDPSSLPDYRLTEIFYEHLTRTIYRQPEFYLWTHNRFKYAID
jgi:acyltransferase, htrB/msbB family